YTHARFLPGTKINQCTVSSSILCEGSIITGARITDSVIGIRAVVQKGTTLERTMLMGANHFESLDETASQEIPIGVGRDCKIRNAIVDFNVRIGDGCRLLNESGIQEASTPNWSIRGGVIVIPKGTTIPAGTVI